MKCLPCCCGDAIVRGQAGDDAGLGPLLPQLAFEPGVPVAGVVGERAVRVHVGVRALLPREPGTIWKERELLEPST